MMKMLWSTGPIAAISIVSLGLSLSPAVAAQGHKGGPPGHAAAAHGDKAAEHSRKDAVHDEKRAAKADTQWEKAADRLEGKGAKGHGRKAGKHRARTPAYPYNPARRARVRPIHPTDRDIVIDRRGYERVIHDYYGRQNLPPGLAKRDALPPGLARQLRERGQLPPGLQKRLSPLPADLARDLPSAPPYYDRYFAGRDLVVVDSRTNRIVSLIRNVLR